MITLGIDTATGACGAALWSPEQGILAVRAEPGQRGQAERLIPLVRAVLAEAGLAFGAVDRIGVTVGPGTFTGLRIGLAAARGLALACDRPLVGITSFEASVSAVGSTALAGIGTVLGCIDSRRADIFVQPFAADGLPDLHPLAPPTDLLPEALAAYLAGLPDGPLLLVGDAAARAAGAMAGAGRTVTVAAPDWAAQAAAVARLTAVLPVGGLAARPAEPHYLRAPDVTLPGPAHR